MPPINLNIKKNCNEEVPIMEATKTGGGKISVSQAFPKIIIQIIHLSTTNSAMIKTRNKNDKIISIGQKRRRREDQRNRS
jgi:hypothetical protein